MIKKIYNKHKNTLHNFLRRTLQIFGKQWSTFLIFFICAKLLDPYNLGIYSYILSILFLVIIFCDFGISISTSRYVVECDTTDNKNLKYILSNSLLIVFWLGSIVTILFLLITYYWLNEYLRYIIYILPLIFLIPATAIYDWIYVWLKKFKKLSLITTSVWLLSVFIVYVFIHAYWLTWAFISQSLFYFMLLIGLFLWHRELKISYNKEITTKIIKYWLLIGIASLGYFLFTRIDILVLWRYGYIKEIWYFEIINKILQIIILPVIILATVIAPSVTKRSTLWDFISIKKNLFKESVLLFISWSIITVCLYFALPIIYWTFLWGYDKNLLMKLSTILLCLIPIRFFMYYTNIWYITPSWNAKILSITTLAYWGLNLVLDLLFIRIFWFMWVIYATVISDVLFNLTNLVYFYLILKKNTS